MKTAEQILSEHTGETGIYLKKGMIRGSDAMEAMEEYKNQSYMKMKAHQLEFISQIKRDGSGTTKVKKSYLKAMLENSFMKDEDFELHCLSLTEKTFVAFNFNAFVVRVR